MQIFVKHYLIAVHKTNFFAKFQFHCLHCGQWHSNWCLMWTTSYAKNGCDLDSLWLSLTLKKVAKPKIHQESFLWPVFYTFTFLGIFLSQTLPYRLKQTLRPDLLISNSHFLTMFFVFLPGTLHCSFWCVKKKTVSTQSIVTNSLF